MPAIFSFLSSFAQTTNIFPASGNVGIGTISPLYNLDVIGNAYIRGSGSYYNNPNNAELQIGYGLAGAGTPGTVTRLAIQPYGHTGGPWQFNARDDASSAYLDINYGIHNAITVHHSGNVGIGTVSPTAKLDVSSVAGMTTLKAVGSNGYILINNVGSGESYYQASQAHRFQGANGEVFTILGAGNVGIGTATPNAKLAVNGNIRAKEVKVENTNWPDYVFAKSYQLPTLLETEKHIKEKGHLPGIPSAAEVKANGVDLGEMNAKLLKKIEELTLHLIEMKKENDARNDSQAKEIEYLKSKLK